VRDNRTLRLFVLGCVDNLSAIRIAFDTARGQLLVKRLRFSIQHEPVNGRKLRRFCAANQMGYELSAA
jgi:hypothetical protein